MKFTLHFKKIIIILKFNRNKVIDKGYFKSIILKF